MPNETEEKSPYEAYVKSWQSRDRCKIGFEILDFINKLTIDVYSHASENKRETAESFVEAFIKNIKAQTQLMIIKMEEDSRAK